MNQPDQTRTLQTLYDGAEDVVWPDEGPDGFDGWDGGFLGWEEDPVCEDEG